MKKVLSSPTAGSPKGRILARALAEDLRTVQGGGTNAGTVTVDRSSDGHTDITNGTSDHDINDI
jgi:hypothetical protein